MVTSLLPLIRHAHLAVLAWIGCILWSLPASAGPYGCLDSDAICAQYGHVATACIGAMLSTRTDYGIEYQLTGTQTDLGNRSDTRTDLLMEFPRNKTWVAAGESLVKALHGKPSSVRRKTKKWVGKTVAFYVRVDVRNWPTTYTMDPLNRTAGTLYVDGSMVTNTWDAAGQQLTSQDITGITSLLWDLNGRQMATQNPTGINLTNTLDPLGNRLVLADPWGVTSYTWDAQSRLIGILNPLNEQTTIQWDPLNRESHRVLANGMAVSPRRHRSDSRDV